MLEEKIKADEKQQKLHGSKMNRMPKIAVNLTVFQITALNLLVSRNLSNNRAELIRMAVYDFLHKNEGYLDWNSIKCEMDELLDKQ